MKKSNILVISALSTTLLCSGCGFDRNSFISLGGSEGCNQSLGQVELRWIQPEQPPTTPATTYTITGYRIRVGQTAGNYQDTIDVDVQQSYDFASPLQEGQDYYFAVAAEYEDSTNPGLRRFTALSNEICKSIVADGALTRVSGAYNEASGVSSVTFK